MVVTNNRWNNSFRPWISTKRWVMAFPKESHHPTFCCFEVRDSELPAVQGQVDMVWWRWMLPVRDFQGSHFYYGGIPLKIRDQNSNLHNLHNFECVGEYAFGPLQYDPHHTPCCRCKSPMTCKNLTEDFIFLGLNTGDLLVTIWNLKNSPLPLKANICSKNLLQEPFHFRN